ncbi:MAG: hypothetical protein MRY64_01875 [Hyphomonadaceae bacterium]|nr:hypothetical protein [Hyphomonadaceae bacterium]
MKNHVVDGTIEVLGDYLATGRQDKSVEMKKYAYIQFRETGGDEVLVKNVTVPVDVDRILEPGATGLFLISKSTFPPSRSLLAAKVGDREAVNEYVLGGAGSYVGAYLQFLVLLIPCILLSFIMIGIPMAMIVIWMMIRYPAWMANLRNVAMNAGFNLKRAKSI